MDTLTLARFICELSLLEMEFVPVRASLLASACLLIALVTKDMGGWVCVYLHAFKMDAQAHEALELYHLFSPTAPVPW